MNAKPSVTCPSCARHLRVPGRACGKKVSCNYCAACFWIQAPATPAPVTSSRRLLWPWMVAGTCVVPIVVVIALLVLGFLWLWNGTVSVSDIMANPAPWLERTVLVRSRVLLATNAVDTEPLSIMLCEDLESGNFDEWLPCYFALGHEARQLRPGDRVIVRGRLVRRRYVYPWPGREYVRLEECQLVDVR